MNRLEALDVMVSYAVCVILVLMAMFAIGVGGSCIQGWVPDNPPVNGESAK